MPIDVFHRVGHGGASALAPGNTLASFDAAVEVGIDMVEFDVRVRRGELYVGSVGKHEVGGHADGGVRGDLAGDHERCGGKRPSSAGRGQKCAAMVCRCGLRNSGWKGAIIPVELVV